MASSSPTTISISFSLFCLLFAAVFAAEDGGSGDFGWFCNGSGDGGTFPAMTARFPASFRRYSGDNGWIWVFRQRQQQVVSATAGSGMFPATAAVFRRWRLGFRRGFRRDSGDGSRWIRRRLLVVLVYDLLKPSVVRKFFLWVLPLRRLPFLCPWSCGLTTHADLPNYPNINEPEVGPARRARLDE